MDESSRSSITNAFAIDCAIVAYNVRRREEMKRGNEERKPYWNQLAMNIIILFTKAHGKQTWQFINEFKYFSHK